MLVSGCSGKPESWPLRSDKDLRGIWWMGRPGNAELTWARQQCYEDVDTRNHKVLFASSKKCIIHHSSPLIHPFIVSQYVSQLIHVMCKYKLYYPVWLFVYVAYIYIYDMHGWWLIITIFTFITCQGWAQILPSGIQGLWGLLTADSCGCESPGNRMNLVSLHNFYKAWTWTIWIFESLVPKFMGQFFIVVASKCLLGLSFVCTEKNPFIRALKTSSVLHV